jgi:type IV pilus assembly protein PilB
VFRDIYEWLTKNKGIDMKTMQAIREYERKNNCTPYAAIEALGVCTVSELGEGVAAIYQLKQFRKNIEDLKTSTFIDQSVMKSNGFILASDPSNPNKDDLYVLIADPLSRIPAVDLIKRAGFRGRLAVLWIPASTFEYWTKRTSHNYGNASFNKIAADIDKVDSMSDDEGTVDEATVDSDDTKDQKIVELTNEIIQQAIDLCASDIHIEPLTVGCRIRYRIDGVLAPFMTLNDRSTVRRLVNRIKVIGRMDVNNSRTPQSGKIKFDTYDIRVSTMPNVSGEKVVFITKPFTKFSLVYKPNFFKF